MERSNDEVLRNQIEEGAVHVYAFHPAMDSKIKSLLKDAPKNCIFYMNPEAERDSLEEANLKDPALKEFIFKEVLPRFGFYRGENPILGDLQEDKKPE